IPLWLSRLYLSRAVRGSGPKHVLAGLRRPAEAPPLPRAWCLHPLQLRRLPAGAVIEGNFELGDPRVAAEGHSLNDLIALAQLRTLHRACDQRLHRYRGDAFDLGWLSARRDRLGGVLVAGLHVKPRILAVGDSQAAQPLHPVIAAPSGNDRSQRSPV